MIKVQAQDFDVGRELENLSRGNRAVGGVCCFIGIVRDMAGAEEIAAMTLEHYPAMTEKALKKIEAGHGALAKGRVRQRVQRVLQRQPREVCHRAPRAQGSVLHFVDLVVGQFFPQLRSMPAFWRWANCAPQ